MARDIVAIRGSGFQLVGAAATGRALDKEAGAHRSWRVTLGPCPRSARSVLPPQRASSLSPNTRWRFVPKLRRVPDMRWSLVVGISKATLRRPLRRKPTFGALLTR